MKHPLRQVYERLFNAFGPQSWWPGDSAFEVMVGAVLTQNTAWKNVEKALVRLRESDSLNPEALHAMSHAELAELIRPAGYYRLKAKRLKNLVHVIAEEFHSDLQRLFDLGRDGLRARLLEINGIGPETADSIVLYAAGLPIFVVDNYTARVVKRHGWVSTEADYYGLQSEFHQQLPTDDAQMFNEYHALIVRVGHHFCGRKPKCDECPLVDLLPESGPLQIDS